MPKTKKSLLNYLINNGVSIPHFCFYKELSIAGNCRICIIELKKSMKPAVSCSTSTEIITNNKIKFYYDSPVVKKSRENILEFILLNHPLDCPICDQGGDCDLQDLSLVYGTVQRRFYKFKRIVSNKNFGPIIKTIMTRCIHCTRCIRFINEISETNEVGFFGRGLKNEIGFYINKILSSKFAGNIADICPVGKMTKKTYLFWVR